MQREAPPVATRTTCPYCGVGCGVLAKARADGTAEIAGEPDHPANFGRLCSKGSALGETLSLDDRLLHPLIHGAQASWDAALDLVATKFREAIAEHGPDSVAFYVSGQILTEDYYVANKLMKGFIGSANIDTNSRLCMASSVAGHKRAFGSDTVPGTYEDLELADLVVLVGSNLAWCHPILFQRLSAAKETRGTKVVVIDPRATATCEIADLHLKIAPGSDVALFNGLLRQLDETGDLDSNYISAHTSGFAAALATAKTSSLAEIATATGLAVSDIREFYALFAATEKAVTVYSQGVNQSIAGTDKVNAIINCHLATGRIGRPGMGPFSVTGQPNAMGGREVGGLANMLASHMELGNVDHRRVVQTFWQSPRIASEPGLKAVDMFRAVADGRIKAIWIMATNPVDSMPEADGVRAALKACPFVVVSDVTRHTDTTAFGDVLFPSLAWGEKDGTVTNSERRISRQRAFLSAPGEARADWWQMAEIGKRLGFHHEFNYANASEVFAEHAQLSAVENGGTRDFDIGRFASISRKDYDALKPTLWPQPAGADPDSSRFFGAGNFFTPDRRARFVETPYRPLACPTTHEFPFVLNTGRIRDQWHTMTRTAKTARLLNHLTEPFLEIHPDDAARMQLDDATLAEVKSVNGRIVVRVLITSRQRTGSVFVPMHWTDQYASGARVCALIHANTDPVSGQPELKAAPVSVLPYEAKWYGFAVSRDKPISINSDYWALAPAKSGWRIELAGLALPQDWDGYVRALFNIDSITLDPNRAVEVLAYHDERSGQHRFAIFEGESLIGAFYASPRPVAVSRTFAADRLDETASGARDRLRILAGRPGANEIDRGAIVCSCFEIGLNQIVEAVTSGGCITLDAVGAALKAGTNCGSCRPEIGRIIHDHAITKAS
jgi:assimilatory nitrate reductase catalytic subunit